MCIYSAFQCVLRQVMSPGFCMRKADGAQSNEAKNLLTVFSLISSANTHLSLSLPVFTHHNAHTHARAHRQTHKRAEHRTSWGPGWSCWAGCGGALWPLCDRSTPQPRRWRDRGWCPGSRAHWTQTDTRSGWSHSPITHTYKYRGGYKRHEHNAMCCLRKKSLSSYLLCCNYKHN